jgi:hypothetical protein
MRSAIQESPSTSRRVEELQTQNILLRTQRKNIDFEIAIVACFQKRYVAFLKEVHARRENTTFTNLLPEYLNPSLDPVQIWEVLRNRFSVIPFNTIEARQPVPNAADLPEPQMVSSEGMNESQESYLLLENTRLQMEINTLIIERDNFAITWKRFIACLEKIHPNVDQAFFASNFLDTSQDLRELYLSAINNDNVNTHEIVVLFPYRS